MDVLSVLLTFSFGGYVVCTFDPIFGGCVVCTFDHVLLVDVLSVLLTLSFGGCVVCTFDPLFWWMCLSLLLTLSFD